jgi:hypothetical protein
MKNIQAECPVLLYKLKKGQCVWSIGRNSEGSRVCRPRSGKVWDGEGHRQEQEYHFECIGSHSRCLSQWWAQMSFLRRRLWKMIWRDLEWKYSIKLDLLPHSVTIWSSWTWLQRRRGQVDGWRHIWEVELTRHGAGLIGVWVWVISKIEGEGEGCARCDSYPWHGLLCG